MKKSFNELRVRNILSSQQMMLVKGGGTCCYLGPEVDGKQTLIENISKEEALWWFGEGGNGAHWCCDSCSSTWYCGK